MRYLEAGLIQDQLDTKPYDSSRVDAFCVFSASVVSKYTTTETPRYSNLHFRSIQVLESYCTLIIHNAKVNVDMSMEQINF